MAIIERPTDTPALAGAGPAVVTPSTSYGVLPPSGGRPPGWKSWVFTVDHKKLGIMYGVVAMVFFFVGGIEALLIRAQLAQPDGTILIGRHVQPDVHDARHHDGVPLRDADGGGVRQLPRAAADRRP